jgi:hypothetical protein
MGWFGSDSTENSKVGNTGEIVNNLTLPAVEKHKTMELLILLWIIAATKIIEIIWIVYKEYTKKMKKRYC